MNEFTLLSGETVTYPDPSPEVARFMNRVTTAVTDPRVSSDAVVALVYGLENPMLNTGMIPGRATVTAAVLADPVFQVMTDMIDRKRIALGELNPEEADKQFTTSVPDAAKQLGIETPSVRHAITAKKLAAIYRNGQWWIHPRSLDSYRVSNRGPKKRTVEAAETIETKAPEKYVRIDIFDRVEPPVLVACGSETGRSLSVRIEGGELVTTGKTAAIVDAAFPESWTRAVVKTTTGNGARAFVIEPANGAAGDITHGNLFVRGQFKVTKKINRTEPAVEAFKSFGKPETTGAKGGGE